MGRILLNTSARNQFWGKVSAVTQGAVNDEITLETDSGLEIIAIVTHESTKNLALGIGVSAYALIKASAIILVDNEPKLRFSTRNNLKGKIIKLQTGAVNTEVVLELKGTDSVVAIITNERAKNFDLAVGKSVSAIFKASSVIVATPA